MKRPTSILAVCASALMLTAGCNKTDAPPPPTAPAPTQSVQEGQAATATASPPAMPPPDVPKDAASAGPKPGQANDHSSPAFKGGGKEVPK